MFSRAQSVFARTYFLLLMLTGVVVGVNLFFGWPLVFYLPFITGGVGSLALYLVKKASLKKSAQDNALKTQAKIICHAWCASVYIIGAFLLLVFTDSNFYASWSFHIWIVPVVIVASVSVKDVMVLFLLLLAIFVALFVLNIGGLPGQVVTAAGMGSFWGFAFYFLLVFLNNIIENTRNRASLEEMRGTI